jgi:crossover junction endodeoxyribonuclease RusA
VTEPKTTYRLDLPWPRPPLRSNDRRHWRKQAEIVATVRKAVVVLALNAKMPYGDHLTVQLHYAPGARTRMDSHNLHPTVKACVDALARGKRRDWVGLELVPDDTDEFVTILAPQIHYPPEPGPKCWLTVEVS